MYTVDSAGLAKIKLKGVIVVKSQAHYVLLNEHRLGRLLKGYSPEFIDLCKTTAKATGYPVNMYWSTEHPPEFRSLADGVEIDYGLLKQIIDIDAIRAIASSGPTSRAEQFDRFKAIYAKALAGTEDEGETAEWLANMALMTASHKTKWVMRTSTDMAIGMLLTSRTNTHLVDEIVRRAPGWHGVFNLMGYDPDKNLVMFAVGQDYIDLSIINN